MHPSTAKKENKALPNQPPAPLLCPRRLERLVDDAILFSFFFVTISTKAAAARLSAKKKREVHEPTR
jgi:hypothetical protein